MRVEKRPIDGYEYVLTLTPEEAIKLHGMFKTGTWERDFCLQMSRMLAEAIWQEPRPI